MRLRERGLASASRACGCGRLGDPALNEVSDRTRGFALWASAIASGLALAASLFALAARKKQEVPRGRA